MKRWALLTVVLYVLCLSIATLPLLYYFDHAMDLLVFFYTWFVPVLVLVQIVLLLVPVAVAQERPIKRRTIIVSAAVGAIPMGVLAAAFFYSVINMIWGERSSPGNGVSNLILPAFFWLIWGVIFWRSFSSTNPNSFTSTMTRWLLRGSILEILVAIPSHIISRQRNDCCAPTFTFLALVTGISIALMSFGPGIFFLYMKRIKDKK
jgi:hypothetical protein